MTAANQPYPQKADFYRTGFMKLQPLKKRAMDDQSVALGYSTTHKFFLLYLDARPDSVQPLVQKLGLVARTAVESELARLKRLQLAHPEDWSTQGPMAGHKTIELLRRAEEVLYQDLQKEASPLPPIPSETIARESEAADTPQTPLTPPEPSKSHPTRGKWPFHIPAPYLLNRLAEDPLLNRMRLFLNLERRQILDKLPQAENLKKTMPADDYRRYQNMIRSCVKELQAFADLVTEHIPSQTERDAILTFSDAEFIRRVFPILAQHTGKAVYALVPDVVVPASFKPTEHWKQLTQWAEWPKLTGFQKRILYLRIGERLRPEALTQRLKKDLGVTDDSITVKGIRTVLEKFYRTLPTELSSIARVEPIKPDVPTAPDTHLPEEPPA